MKRIDQILTDITIPKAIRTLSGRSPLFFDIETTGLSPAGYYVYLIGCLSETEDGLRFRQWFAENADEEAEVLRSFCETIEPGQVLVHYNGTTFDLPFLAARIKRNRLSLTLPDKEETIDLYRNLSPCKKLFGLSNRRQPTLEKLAGYDRTDTYDGGTLVPFYTEYVARCRFDPVKAGELLDALLLHNRDDILGLSQLGALLPYCTLSEAELSDALFTEQEGIITCTATLPDAFPKPFRKVLPLPEIPADCRTSDGCPDELFADLMISENTLRLSLPVYDMAPYFYFPNYKDYYYLPVEEKAVHKSLATCVSKEYRKPATRETARQQKSGSFLPQYAEQFGPAFRFRPGDTLCFFERRELTPDALSDYIRSWIRVLLENRF